MSCCACRSKSATCSANGCRLFSGPLGRAVSLIQSMHGGKDYEAKWGQRMAGSGPYAWMIGRRFETAARRLGYRETNICAPTFSASPSPRRRAGAQLSLF